MLERLIPPARSRAAALDLPAVVRAADVGEAAREVIAAAARGELTLAEAREWMSLLDRQRATLETQELRCVWKCWRNGNGSGRKGTG